MSGDELSVPAKARIGSVLKDKYRLDRILGEGGMATVFAATHTRNKNRVAVKVLHRDVALDAGLRGRFLREGYAANSVEHPGTVRILDDDVAEDGAVFLVMELLDGETLEARWERKGRQLKPGHVADLLYQLLDVLALAHAQGIVHRDIKPANLFYTREGTLKVLDFGVARLIERSVSVTHSGGILGTPAFMAPEQVLGKMKEVDAQSDLWSVGATAFTLLSGRYVHEAETPEEMMVLTASRPARSLASVLPNMPPPLASVVDRALLFAKAERWADARTMQAAIASAYREVFGVSIPSAVAKKDRTVAPSVPAPADAMPASQDGGPRAIRDSESEGGPPSTSVATTAPRFATIAGVAATWTKLFLASEKGGPRRLSHSALVAIAVTVALLGVGTIVAVMDGRRDSSSVAASPASGVTAAVTASVPTVSKPTPSAIARGAAAATNEPPTISIQDLATMTSPTNAASRPSSSKIAASPARPLPAGVPKTSCSPPFTVDATGIKKWKAECL
jgi:serine/threonine-protein kinase